MHHSLNLRARGEEEHLWTQKNGKSQTRTHQLEGGRGRVFWAQKHGMSPMRTHQLEGRKREKHQEKGYLLLTSSKAKKWKSWDSVMLYECQVFNSCVFFKSWCNHCSIKRLFNHVKLVFCRNSQYWLHTFHTFYTLVSFLTFWGSCQVVSMAYLKCRLLVNFGTFQTFSQLLWLFGLIHCRHFTI